MITPKIKALFQFIEYLHSNIDNFNLNNDLIKELEQLDEERHELGGVAAHLLSHRLDRAHRINRVAVLVVRRNQFAVANP